MLHMVNRSCEERWLRSSKQDMFLMTRTHSLPYQETTKERRMADPSPPTHVGS